MWISVLAANWSLFIQINIIIWWLLKPNINKPLSSSIYPKKILHTSSAFYIPLNSSTPRPIKYLFKLDRWLIILSSLYLSIIMNIINRVFPILLILILTHSQPIPTLTDNCLSVSSQGSCLQCVVGFYLEYFVCLPCAPLCTCSSQYNYC